ncbi:MAG: hypothetical protein Q8T11_12990 [Elusimicrobiota bacterium]|nr:hypothetical protein [Elusimicrobiota bacterium]
MRAVIVAAALAAAGPAWGWEKAHEGAGIERFTERGGKLWALPGLSSSTDRGKSWVEGLDAVGLLDSDVSDDRREISVLPKNYLHLQKLDDEEETLNDGVQALAAISARFLGRTAMVIGFSRDSKDDKVGVLISRDDGASWTTALSGPLDWRVRPYVLDEKRAWICSGDGIAVIWRTVNGGRDWERSSASTPLFGECDELFFLDKKRGWASIGSGAARTIHATDDGGDEWETRGTISLSTAGSVSLAFADKNRGWAAAPGAFWETADGGKTWTSRPAPPSAVLPEAVALRYVEERGGGRLLYGTSLSEVLPEDDEANVTGRETRSRGEIWKLEAPAP